MAFGKGTVNKVIQLGRLGSDPEIRTTQNSMVANFNIATTEAWKDKDGKAQEVTDWTRCVAWGPSAGFIQNYVKKGSLVYVEGRLKNRSWDDDKGNKHYVTEVRVDSVQLVGNKNNSQKQQTESSPEMPDDDLPF